MMTFDYCPTCGRSPDDCPCAFFGVGGGLAAPQTPGEGAPIIGAQNGITARPVLYPHRHNRGMGLLHEGDHTDEVCFLEWADEPTAWARLAIYAGLQLTDGWYFSHPPPPTDAFTIDPRTGRLVLVTGGDR